MKLTPNQMCNRLNAEQNKMGLAIQQTFLEESPGEGASLLKSHKTNVLSVGPRCINELSDVLQKSLVLTVETRKWRGQALLDTKWSKGTNLIRALKTKD